MSTPDAPEKGRVFARRSIQEDVERELRSHLEERTEELVGKGWDRARAAEEAERLFGDRAEIHRSCVDIVRRHHRAVRRTRTMDAFLQDLKFGWRSATRSPGFAIVALVTLALGIGANSTIFSVVRGVLLAPLPYEEPESLVSVWEARRQGGSMSVAWSNFLDWRAESPSLEGMFAFGAGSTTVIGGQQPTIATVARVSEGFWSVLRIVPLRGRLTTAGDHTIGAPPVVVVSRSFWESQLASRPLEELLLDVSGHRAQVVGVVADEVAFPAGAQLWRPVELDEQGMDRTAHNFGVVGRLAPDVPMDRAAVELDELTRRIVASETDADPDFLAVGATLVGLREQIVQGSARPLWMLLGAAGLVLLVACTNLASTLLARGAGRARELAVRASLGAGRRRIVRQLVTESVVLALGGALAGLGLTGLILSTLRRLGPGSLPRLDEIGVDGLVLAYTFGVAFLTVVLVGLLPAVRLARGGHADALRSGTRGNARKGGGIWTVLVGSEVALALVLLVGSGLLIRSFQTLLAEDPGLDSSDLLTSSIALSGVKYETPDDHARWWTSTLEEVDRLPGVAASGFISSLPLAGSIPNGLLELDGDLEKRAVAGYVLVSGGTFEALDVPLLMGRTFDVRDTPDQPHVAIVSQSFVDEFWPGENPIGRSVTGGGMDNHYQDRRFAEVVGVVGDVRYRSLGAPPIPVVYFPVTQRPFRSQYSANLVAEAESGDPGSIAESLRGVIRTADPDVPLQLSTHEEVIGESVAARRFTTLLLTSFSVVALLLAVVGIYGVVSYSVARRRREMGIRLALGAGPGSVLGMVMRSSMRMVASGIVVGLAASFAAGRVVQGLLYGVGRTDPLALAIATGTLTFAAALAAWVPARRSTRVDPMVTMRSE